MYLCNLGQRPTMASFSDSNARHSIGTMSTRPLSSDESMPGGRSYPRRPRRRRRYQSDRVVLDVGGEKFVTSKSTLLTNSAYFAAQFSSLWDSDEEDDNEEEYQSHCQYDNGSNHQQEYFLDQDPAPFSVLLSYMRKAMIKIEDLADLEVLLLAEFLGMETIVSAVKLKCFRNMYPDSEVAEKEALNQFNDELGNIKNAVSAGFLPRFLLESNSRKNSKEYAIATFELDELQHDLCTITTKDKNEQEMNLPLIGCLNWLAYHGYTEREEGLSQKCRWGDEMAFFRPSTKLVQHHADTMTDIFLQPSAPLRQNRKAYVMMLTDREYIGYVLYAPAASDEIVPEGNIYNGGPVSCRWCARLDLLRNGEWELGRTDGIVKWLEDNGYNYRELEWEEQIFKEQMEKYMPAFYLHDPHCNPSNREFKIFSRQLT